MSKNNKVPPMTRKTLIAYIISVILLGLFFFFTREDFGGKLIICILCTIIIIYFIYAYQKEKKSDKNASIKNEKILNGEFFESAEWKSRYSSYLNDHPFETPKYPSMKKDLLVRFHRREYIVGMLFMSVLMVCSYCCILMQEYLAAVIGILLFGFLFYLDFAKFIGKPVRRWLKGDIDYDVLEASYLKSRMLTYKKNGFALGTTHIHAYTEKKIYAIDYRLVEGIWRKVVRLKHYEDFVYSSEEYQHFAVIHVRLPRSGTIHNVEIELNEFQVQMVIDKLPVYKLGEELQENLTLDLETDNITV